MRLVVAPLPPKPAVRVGVGVRCRLVARRVKDGRRQHRPRRVQLLRHIALHVKRVVPHARPRVPSQQAVRTPRIERGQEVVAAAELAHHVVAVIDIVRAPTARLLPRPQAVCIPPIRLCASE